MHVICCANLCTVCHLFAVTLCNWISVFPFSVYWQMNHAAVSRLLQVCGCNTILLKLFAIYKITKSPTFPPRAVAVCNKRRGAIRCWRRQCYKVLYLGGIQILFLQGDLVANIRCLQRVFLSVNCIHSCLVAEVQNMLRFVFDVFL